MPPHIAIHIAYDGKIKKTADTELCANAQLKGTSINCRERLEYKADRAQKPECTCEYMRISSTAQRSNRSAEQINRGALKTASVSREIFP